MPHGKSEKRSGKKKKRSHDSERPSKVSKRSADQSPSGAASSAFSDEERLAQAAAIRAIPSAASLPPAKLPEAFQTRHLINGEFVPSVSGKTFATLNPSTGKEITQVCEGNGDDIDKAVRAARSALPMWKKVAPREKGRMLFKFAEIMERNREELATLESLDNGKPRLEAYNVDLPLAINTIRYYAGWADKLHGSTIPMESPHFCFTKREPVGVVGQIIPWNFPICMAAWKLGPALACGNVVVMKPAENTPLTALRMAEMMVEAGFPPGVVNMVSGYGHIAGDALTKHPEVDKIAFTGSTRVGKVIGAECGKQIKRCTLELGGKSPLFICEDADLDAAVATAHVGLFLNQGQCCCASSRLFVHEKVYDEFVKKTTALAKSRTVGNPFSEETKQGPQVSELQFNTVMGYINSGKAQGAKLMTGGRKWGKEGYFIEPTVFSDVTDDMKIAQEEIFGPVMSIIKFSDLKEALARGNKTRYGLAAGVFTKSIKTAMEVVNEIEAGSVWVNTYDVLHEAAPFGGFKESGIGRELGEYAINLYTEIKTVTINTSI